MAIQIRSRQDRTQLIHVATPHVEPAPEPDSLGFEPRPHSVPKQRHESHAAGLRFVEARGFGCAGIDRGHGQIPGDVAKRMRISNGQIVQATPYRGIPADREVRLMTVEIECGSVDASDPDTRVAWLTRGERQGQIALSSLRSAR